MRKVKIVTDSTADLSAELVERYDVDIVPLAVHLGEDEYKDGVDIKTADVFAYADKTKTLPKTAAASVAEFEETFKKWIDNDCDVVYMGIGSKLSATYMSAKLATESLPEGRVRVVDSLNLSTGIALLVCKAGDMVKEGKSAEEIAAKLNEIVPKVRAGFVVDVVDYLYMGGRCSAMANFMAGVLKLRPRLAVKDGVIISDQKYRGTYERCLMQYTKDIIGGMVDPDKTRVFITRAITPGSDLGEKDAEKVQAELESLGFGEILHTEAGCVISSHCGPRTLGILYIEN